MAACESMRRLRLGSRLCRMEPLYAMVDNWPHPVNARGTKWASQCFTKRGHGDCPFVHEYDWLSVFHHVTAALRRAPRPSEPVPAICAEGRTGSQTRTKGTGTSKNGESGDTNHVLPMLLVIFCWNIASKFKWRFEAFKLKMILSVTLQSNTNYDGNVCFSVDHNSYNLSQ